MPKFDDFVNVRKGHFVDENIMGPFFSIIGTFGHNRRGKSTIDSSLGQEPFRICSRTVGCMFIEMGMNQRWRELLSSLLVPTQCV